MTSQRKNERMDALQGLMDRLCHPDLTLGEAKDLRQELKALLEGDTPRFNLARGTGPCVCGVRPSARGTAGWSKPSRRSARSLCGIA